jgi:hypothetical protein
MPDLENEGISLPSGRTNRHLGKVTTKASAVTEEPAPDHYSPNAEVFIKLILS